MNPIKSKLKQGQPVIGNFLLLPSPDIAEILALSGLDFVVVDMEHSPTNFEGAQHIFRAIKSGGSTPFIRVNTIDQSSIERALDIGAYGIHIPQVSTVEEVQNVVNWIKYYPQGSRGVSYNVRSGLYGLKTMEEQVKFANEEILIAISIENLEAVHNLEDILTVKDVDIINVAPHDLSQSMGFPGQVNHPKVQEMINYINKTSLEAGFNIGGYAKDSKQLASLLEQGVKYIKLPTSTQLISNMFKSLVDDIRSVL
ncbi:HpcH/HpaI aldolase family protein [Bacillus sp. Marseille-P3661]|uniref:HpcH/HpaI aldolase family protein n=1 Tax=Bacillus sp. Marseille-P3661 TaxID=1936234 RepID=UPI000C83697B|nr:aldolase/citrate lyase family protein [Bacillus sp. Marseille-P3661]